MSIISKTASVRGRLLVWSGLATACGHRADNDDQVHADQHLLAVFDGVGGRPLGGVAAAIALGHALATSASLRAQGRLDVQEVIRSAGRALSDNNDRIGLNTATTAAVVALHCHMDTPLATVGWVGDTSAFLVRDGRILKLTRPHSAPTRDAQRTQLTRWLGDESLSEAEVEVYTLIPEDRILVCSDGITDVLPDIEIGGIVADADTPQGATELLIAEALRRGTRDNSSAAIAFIVENSGLSPASSGPMWTPPTADEPAATPDIPPADTDTVRE